MPEGDTVWRTARHLHQALSGHELTGCDLRVPAYASLDLSGQVVQETVSRGKHLLTRIGDQHTVHTHLKMEGAWHLYRHGTGWRRPPHQARVVLETAPWVAVGFSLGVTEVVARTEEDTVVGHLGPDLLGVDWDEAEALRLLRGDPDRPVGEALLDQRNLAGVGNMYESELCFLQGVHPTTPVAEVDLVPLIRRAKSVLEANKLRAEQTTTGDLRRGRRLWVYRRRGQPCRRCRTPVLSAPLGTPPRERVTYWCPLCQRR